MVKRVVKAMMGSHLHFYTGVSVLAVIVALACGMYPTAVVWAVVALLLWKDFNGFLAQHLSQFTEKQIAIGEMAVGLLFLLFAWYRWGDSIGTHYVALVVGVVLFARGAYAYSQRT